MTSCLGPAGLMGVDSAYTLNGYVYHTSFDSIEEVPGDAIVLLFISSM